MCMELVHRIEIVQIAYVSKIIERYTELLFLHILLSDNISQSLSKNRDPKALHSPGQYKME